MCKTVFVLVKALKLIAYCYPPRRIGSQHIAFFSIEYRPDANDAIDVNVQPICANIALPIGHRYHEVVRVVTYSRFSGEVVVTGIAYLCLSILCTDSGHKGVEFEAQCGLGLA